MNGETITLSTGAFLCSSGNFDVNMKFGGFRSLFAKEGAFFLQITGTGDLWFNSYGGVHEVPVNGTFTVDNGHLVGFQGNLTFDIKTAGGGMMGFMASGEGLVCQFNGQGHALPPIPQHERAGRLADPLPPLLTDERAMEFQIAYRPGQSMARGAPEPTASRSWPSPARWSA